MIWKKRTFVKGNTNQVVLQIGNKFIFWSEANYVTIMPAYETKVCAIFELRNEHSCSRQMVRYTTKMGEEISSYIYRCNSEKKYCIIRFSMLNFVIDIGNKTGFSFDIKLDSPISHYIKYILSSGKNDDHAWCLVNQKGFVICDSASKEQLIWKTCDELVNFVSGTKFGQYSIYFRLINSFGEAIKYNTGDSTFLKSNETLMTTENDFKNENNFEHCNRIQKSGKNWSPMNHINFSSDFKRTVLTCVMSNRSNKKRGLFIPRFVFYEIVKLL